MGKGDDVYYKIGIREDDINVKEQELGLQDRIDYLAQFPGVLVLRATKATLLSILLNAFVVLGYSKISYWRS